MSYKIELSARAEKEVLAISSIFLDRIVATIDGLARNPRPRGANKLKGLVSEWRVREGRHRILYSIDDDEKVVFIIRVTDRKEAYRNI